MSKCEGCGVALQNTDKMGIGYVANLDSNICERCFRIIHYNDYKRIDKDNESISEILSCIKKEDLVVLIIDILNIPQNLDIIKNNIKSNILLVISKQDLLMNEIYEPKFLEIVNNLDIKFIDKVLVSANKNYNLDLLMTKIKNHKKSPNVYFIGYSNSGKSTLINKIIYNYTNIEKSITTSLLPSTTLDTIDIKLDEDFHIIDTPGLLESGSMLDLVDKAYLSKLMPRKTINPRIYQIKKEQILNVEDLVSIKITPLNDLIFYVSNDLSITREFKKEIEGQEIKMNANEDLVITGLGFIKFKRKTKITLNLKYNVKVYTRKTIM